MTLHPPGPLGSTLATVTWYVHTGGLCRLTYLSDGTAYPHSMTLVWVGGWKTACAGHDVRRSGGSRTR